MVLLTHTLINLSGHIRNVLRMQRYNIYYTAYLGYAIVK